MFFGGGTHSIHSDVSFNSLRKDDHSYGVIFNQFSNRYKVCYDDVSKSDDIFKSSLINLKTFVKKISNKNIFCKFRLWQKNIKLCGGFLELTK